MPLFSGLLKHKPKSPGELVSKLRNSLQAIDTPTRDRSPEKAGKEATELIYLLKVALLGDELPAPTPAQAEVDAMAEALLASDVLFLMVFKLSKLQFETRKDVVTIFSFMCKHVPGESPGNGSSQRGGLAGLNGSHRRSAHDLVSLNTMKAPSSSPGLTYVVENPRMLDTLCGGYNDATVALNCGSMLRDALRDSRVVNHILRTALLEEFFQYVQKTAFEVASDAFNTFKRLLTQHEIVSEFLQENHVKFFKMYEELLQSKNYATQRQSLKLLADILMARPNVRVMFEYVKSKRHLMLVMNLLRSSSRSIQHEAFHVFKVFVANPRKPDDIKSILVSNRDKLLRFLSQFLEEREAEDEDFAREKADIMSEIEALEPDPTHVLRSSPSMTSRDIANFRNMSFSSLGGSHRTVVADCGDETSSEVGGCPAGRDPPPDVVQNENGSSASLQGHDA
eukprot:jgi/Ulvmu1/1774/UM118_0013.1